MTQRKRVVLKCLADDIIDIYTYLSTCYDVIGISDTNNKKGLDYSKKLGVKFFRDEDIVNIDFDLIIVCSNTIDTFNNVFREYVYKWRVARDKIQYYKEFYKEQYIENDPDSNEKVYILRLGKNMGGIGTLLVFFISQMANLPDDIKIYVDMKNYRNVYLEKEEIGLVNAWEYWFEQPNDIAYDELYFCNNIILGGMGEYAMNYISFWLDEKKERELSRKLKKRFRLNTKMRRVLEVERERLDFDGKRICAVIYRGSDYTFLKTYHHPIQPSIDEMINKIYEKKTEWGFQKIYLFTEDKNAYKRFREEFGEDMLFSERALIDQYPMTDSKVYSDNDRGALTNVKFERDYDSYYKGVEYLRQIVLASECDYVISGNNGGYWCTLLFSNGFKGKFCFDLGVYGEDDDSYATPIGHYVLINQEREIEKKRKEIAYGKG